MVITLTMIEIVIINWCLILEYVGDSYIFAVKHKRKRNPIKVLLLLLLGISLSFRWIINKWVNLLVLTSWSKYLLSKYYNYSGVHSSIGNKL